MDAIELLKQDHREARNLIEQLESGSQDETASPNMELFNKLKSALMLHTEIEEQIFYPPLENYDETRDLVKEAYKEHEQVDELLAEMSNPGDDWNDQLSELKESIEHHVGEEENEMFPTVEKLFGQERLQEMGRQMSNMKRGKGTAA
jgi:hemerythrin-like domain-containing protein